MPRAAKGARLWFRRARREGERIRPAEFVILDGGKHYSTGCGADERAEAERALSEHIARKYQPTQRERHPSDIDVADVILVYANDRPPIGDPAADARLAGRIDRLIDFWSGRSLASVSVKACQEYVSWRLAAERKGKTGGRKSGVGGARRDLEDLRAAVTFHAEKRLHKGHVNVWLPERGEARDRWLTRDEAAALIWACWRAREQQKRTHDGRPNDAKAPTKKLTSQHIARFVLLGLYTGTRAASIASASYVASSGRSYVDLDQGVFYRLPEGKKATRKRQPPVPLPSRLLAHMRRWRRIALADTESRTNGYVVEYRGRPVQSVKTGFAKAVVAAKLSGKVTPHTLRHTCATWLMHAGVSQFEAAGFLGVSVQILDSVYAHQDLRHLRGAAEAIGRKPANAQPTNALNRRGLNKNIVVR